MWIGVIVGTLIALLSGMGVGGGGLFAVYLSMFTDIPQLSVQGYNLLFFLFSAGASVIIQLFRRKIPFFAVGIMILSGVAGASAGFLMTSVISADLLRRLFGIMLVSGGIVSLRKLSKRKYDEKISSGDDGKSENTTSDGKRGEEKGDRRS